MIMISLFALCFVMAELDLQLQSYSITNKPSHYRATGPGGPVYDFSQVIQLEQQPWTQKYWVQGRVTGRDGQMVKVRSKVGVEVLPAYADVYAGTGEVKPSNAARWVAENIKAGKVTPGPVMDLVKIRDVYDDFAVSFVPEALKEGDLLMGLGLPGETVLFDGKLMQSFIFTYGVKDIKGVTNMLRVTPRGIISTGVKK